ncbi:MAG: von Willebrand factor type A domain-containing protein [Paludibacter sp.]|jgi:Ca-activated chloride channel family protein|nr:von Willebrand factor type A domain-containing protein [Paludibacter sp.]
MKAIRLLLVMSMMVFFSGVLSAQTIEVKGKVTDETLAPVAGVTVQEKGTRNGTVTDLNGEYKINVTVGKTLVFAYIGYQRTEKKVTGPRLDVQLQPDQQALQEVVMVGYGSANNSLQGRLAGLSGSRKQNRGMRIYPPAMPYNVSIAEDNEEYGAFRENRFIPVKSEALSTFSLDVDAASYGNIRRMINQGQMPQKDAVRVEELINYFSYDYPQPEGEHPVNIVTEAAVCPWNAKHQLVRIGVKAREIPSEKLPASNFVFLIDVSGSMSGPQKLDLVKSSLRLLVNNLREKDKVSIVVYAGAAGEVLPATPGSDRQKIREAIENLSAGGSTAGGAGIQLAYKIAEKNFIKDGNNRIILCTDGDFNVGVSSSDELESLIESKRKTGVYLTVLGYGMGNYKDKKLQTLAEKGNGNHAYIDNIQEANKVLVNEFGSTMFTVAKDVKIQVEFNPAQVNAYRLVGYETRLLNKEDFNDDTKDAGELGSGHTVTALYEIVPVGVESNFGSVDDLKYQPAKKEKSNPTSLTDELLTVKLRYKQPESNSSQKIEVPVKASVKEASDDYKFVMAVAMFGQLLRDSDFKGSATYAKVIELARNGLVNDQNGYRREFVRLAESVNQMEK